MEILQYIDLFGSTCHFYIDKKPKYYTEYGGIMSILSIITYILLFVILCHDDFTREIPTTTTSSIPSSGFRRIKPKTEKIFIPWRIINYVHEYINHTNILYPIITYRNGEKIPNSTKTPLADKIIPYKLCNETSMKNVDKNIFLIDFPIDQFYCIDMDDLYLGGGWDNDFLYFISLDLYLCENGIDYNETNPKCTSFEKLSELMGNNNSWIFQFLYPLVQFQPSNINYPGIILYKSGFFHLSRWTNKLERIYMQENVINDDLGWVKKTPKNTSYWGVSSISGDSYFIGNKKDLMNEGSTSRLFSFKIYLDMGIIYSTRRYKKIIELLIDTLPILSLLFSIFKSFTRFFKKASTNQKLIELLFENKTRKDKKFNKLLSGFRTENNFQSSISYINSLGKNRLKNFQKDQNSSIKYFSSNCAKKKQLLSNKNEKIERDPNFIIRLNSNNKFDNNCKDNQSVLAQSKILFPYKYYLYSFFLKTININQCKNYFSNQYIQVYSYLSQLIDINSYLGLQKQFALLKKSLLNEQNLIFVETQNKININRKGFMRDISHCLKGNTLNLFP